VIRRWLLIEHPGPWPIEALHAADFTPELRTLLSQAARQVVGRVLLVRRPGRAGQDRGGRGGQGGRRGWAVVTESGTHWGEWGDADDLRIAARVLRDPDGEPDPAPLLLVCAHGVHDTCCALRGRPVAAQLEATFPGAVWECSHVGGDRFAPNVVVLPDGVYYGYLDGDVAPGVLRRHLDGEVSARHLRGITRHPAPAQAAIGEVHRRFGPYGFDDVAVRRIVHPVAGRSEIELVLPDGRELRASVVTAPRAPARLTCRAPLETSALDYRVVELG
jgi:hypothetical protein